MKSQSEHYRQAGVDIDAELSNHNSTVALIKLKSAIYTGNTGTCLGDLRVAVVANPRPGDRIEIDGDAFLIQGEPVRDRERLVWTVDLRPA